jgi:hypothetical protein
VELGLTGRPVLSADEMRTTNNDMAISTVLALVLVTALTIFFFRRLRRPLLAVLALMVSVTITFGVVTLTLGYLTLLSIVFAVMIVGLGCDFGMLFLARYQEELIATGDVSGSTRTTFLSSGMGIWTGGVTTACTFYSVLLVRFKGLAELGLVAGTGLMICLITMLTLLPALILVTDRHIQRRRRLMPPRPIRIPFLEHAARYPRRTLVALVFLTAAGFYGFKGVPYNPNLLDLQVQNLESVRYEKLITAKTDRGTWYASFISKSLEEVDTKVEKLREYQEKGIVGAVESIRDFVPADQDEKLKILKPAYDVVSSLALPSTDGQWDSAALYSSLEGLLDRLDQLQSLSAQYGQEGREAVRVLNSLIGRVEALRDLLAKDRGELKERLLRYQERWFEELKALKSGLAAVLKPEKIVPASLHPELHLRFVSADKKKFLIYAYPKKNIWEENNMEEFIQATTKVDPEVTGVPMHVYQSERLMRDAFLQAALYALIMVFVFLLLDFRSLKYAVLTMAPVLVGIVWAFELMPRLGLDINMANFFSLPILLGCAVDGCVHMLHRFRETGSTAEAGRTTGAAVCLAALSNMLGFASMGIAQHRGLASLGLLTALGCGTILVASVIFLPCLLAIFEERTRRQSGTGAPRKHEAQPVPAKARIARSR